MRLRTDNVDKLALVLAVIMLLSMCTGCSALPHAVAVELEHVSHPLAGWPVEPQHRAEDELNALNALGRWRWQGAGGVAGYVDAGLGVNLLGSHGAGFYGPALTGTVRVGVEFKVKE